MTRSTLPLTRDALSLIAQARSVEAGETDRVRLEQWKDRSPDHEAAYRRASSLYLEIAAAAHELSAERSENWEDARRKVWKPEVGRRAMLTIGLGSAVAASITAAVLWPPFALWPSLADEFADYHTRIGQRRTVTVVGAILIELNTKTSLDASQSKGGAVITLIKGEAAVSLPQDANRSVRMISRNGEIRCQGGTFTVKDNSGSVIVMCLMGSLNVRCGDREAVVPAQSEVNYSMQGLGTVIPSSSAETATAWRNGTLLFRNAPVETVVDEINRYRPGRVVLLNAALGTRRVTARLEIDKVDEIFPHLKAVLGATVRKLPGGVVFLS